VQVLDILVATKHEAMVKNLCDVQ